jgi:hypothetical protein
VLLLHALVPNAIRSLPGRGFPAPVVPHSMQSRPLCPNRAEFSPGGGFAATAGWMRRNLDAAAVAAQ